MNVVDNRGYVPNSIMEIWTEVIDHQTLNIVHIHVNDTSDTITLDVRYV